MERNFITKSRKSRLQRRRVRMGSENRSAVAAVETALLLPLLMLLTFGSIELANVVFLKQALALASYESVRAATRPGATAAEAEARAVEVLTARGVADYTITITPRVSSSTTRGTMVTVNVSSSAGALGLGPMKIASGITVQKQTSMVRL